LFRKPIAKRKNETPTTSRLPNQDIEFSAEPQPHCA
jgi:hypothetical protein